MGAQAQPVPILGFQTGTQGLGDVIYRDSENSIPTEPSTPLTLLRGRWVQSKTGPSWSIPDNTFCSEREVP
jgi:hypothetical protein